MIGRTIRDVVDGYRRAMAPPYAILCPAPPRQEASAFEEQGAGR